VIKPLLEHKWMTKLIQRFDAARYTLSEPGLSLILIEYFYGR
jgi:hypothetical protein